MSFRCVKCNGAQKPPDARPVRLVMKKRHKSYMGGSVGWEVVQEGNFCQPCSKTQGEPVWTVGE